MGAGRVGLEWVGVGGGSGSGKWEWEWNRIYKRFTKPQKRVIWDVMRLYKLIHCTTATSSIKRKMSMTPNSPMWIKSILITVISLLK